MGGGLEGSQIAVNPFQRCGFSYGEVIFDEGCSNTPIMEQNRHEPKT
jgi:hypothetical protein